jgi:hypothetical protein
MNLEQFRSRPLVVTVKELCPNCQTLKEGVKLREHKPYHYATPWTLKSCEPCFEAEKHTRATTTEDDYYAW